MKKILFLITSLGAGGAEKVLVDLLNLLDKDKYEIDLLTVIGGVHEARLTEQINYRKLLKKQGFLSKLIFKMSPKLFRKLFIKKKYDIEIAYLEGFSTRVVAQSKNARKIAFVHCDVSVKPILQNVYKSKEACLEDYRRLDTVCFVSKMAQEGFEKTFDKLDNGRVLHNVMNVADIKEKANEANDFEFNTNGLKIISVGRLSPEKGYERLVRVASQLERKYDFELCLLGDGPEREKIENLIKELNIKSVRLLGFQKNPYSYMKKADLYVCPSFFEGYSTTVTECMVLGVPVLTTDCAGMDEILDNGKCGLIVENSEECLEKGFITLFENQQAFDSINMSAKEKQGTFDKENLTKEYDDLFKELL
ncbi:MAG: glycosyltransferase [Clostridia bacterium]|nr:glycosyltransferase [Clostridia bacterium]